MKILMVEPEKVPYEAEIERGLEALQAAVEGYIEAVYPYEDPVAIVCNEEGKLNGLPLNRALYDDEGEMYDILAGKFLIVGLSENGFTDLSDALMKKYMERFLQPEKFLRANGRLFAFPMEVPETKPQPSRYEVVVYHHIENGFDEKLWCKTLEEAEKVAQGYVNGTMEEDGFQYGGAAVYDLQERRHIRIYGEFPDEKAQAQVREAAEQEAPEQKPNIPPRRGAHL